MKVHVWSGDGQTYLGIGEYTEDVTVFIWYDEQGSLRSLENAEQTPDIPGVIEEPCNPKIVMEEGKVWYGCQVWWKPARTIGKN